MQKFMASWGRLAASLAVLVVLVSPSWGVAAERFEVPIYQTVIRGHGGDGIRYYVSIKIGDEEPMQAMLDTGSSGLWVLASGFSAPEQLSSAASAIQASYNSGDMLIGRRSEAILAISSAQSPRPVKFALATSARCVPQVPNCVASKTGFDDYRISSEGYSGQGFKAILGISLGVNLGDDPLPNPLASIAQSWILELPLPGAVEPGRLILNPDENDIDGFQMFELAPGARHWQGAERSGIPGCMVAEQGRASLCAEVSFDTGSNSIVVETADHALFENLRSWNTYAFEFGEGDSKLTWHQDITPRGFVQKNVSQGHAPMTMIVGYPVCWSLMVLYDYGADAVGLKQR